MAIIEINKNPSKRELNWFGLLFLLFFGIVGGIVWFNTKSLRAPAIIWSTAAVIVIVYYAAPQVRRPLYLVWMYAALPLGWIMSHLVLAAIFYGVITPIGLLMRLLGKDPMQRKIDRTATTYWTEHHPGGDAARYFRQF